MQAVYLATLATWAYRSGRFAGLAAPRPNLVFLAIGLLALGNAGIAFYHVGVEQGLWLGPASCSGGMIIACPAVKDAGSPAGYPGYSL